MAALSITQSDVMPSADAQVIHGLPAGVELTAGEFVYHDPEVDYIWRKVYAAAPFTGASQGQLFGQIRGIVLNHAYTGQPVSVAVNDTAFNIGATLVKGETYWADGFSTPGAIIPTGDLDFDNDGDIDGIYMIQVGIAASTSILVLSPYTSEETG